MNYFFNNKIAKFAGVIIIVLAGVYGAFLFFEPGKYVYAQALRSKDAIAIRVIPNPEHYSPLRWYKNEGWTGSPQSITVDGYEAIRDGRTVYVNAANIVNGVLYTNIYLISYNQDSEKETTDIFSKILKNWKFNTNISGTGNCSNTVQGDCSNTAGCWLFDEDFKDGSGNNNNGNDFGTGVVFADGVAKKAASFDGVNDRVQISNPMGLSAGPFTISHWIKTTQGSSQVYTVGNAGDGRGYRFGITSGKISFLVGNGVAIYTEGICGSKTVNDGKWHLITGVYDRGNAFSCYFDGVFENSIPIPLYAGMNDIAPGIGSPPCCTKFKGQLDQVKIFKSALTPEQISEEYSAGRAKQCIADSECSSNNYCNSPKANITRDTIRLSRLVELNFAINNYKNKKGYFPKLEQGTYLPHTTLSTWPSWQENLGKELGVNLPLDPINKLGSCPGYDQTTCWNKDSKKFSDSDSIDPSLNPPANSDVFIYSAAADGSGYNVCSIMGSGYVTGTSTGACSGSASMIYAGSAANYAPKFTGFNLTGYSGKPFNGYIAAVDANGDFIKWSMDSSVTPSWMYWSAAPIMQNTALTNQKKIYSPMAGNAGTYQISVTISDGKGLSNSTTTQTFTIKILNNMPVINAGSITYTASSTVPINYQLTARDVDLNYPLNYSLVPAGFDIIGLADSFVFNGSDYVYKRTGAPTPIANTFDSASSLNLFTYKIYVGDSFGATSTASFSITVVNNPPQLSVPAACANDTRINSPYSCQASATDPEGNIITYGLISSLATLNINPVTGLLTDSPATQGTYNVRPIATDEYNYNSVYNYQFTVNTYCGDGVKQGPIGNTENRGGPADNGVEECDGTQGVATMFTDGNSSAGQQYACTTPVGSECALGAASCAGTCKATGGWCGDGICGSKDATYTADDGEICDVCKFDCGTNHDNDADGIGACTDVCPDVRDPLQIDTDGDGMGDLCDYCYTYNNACVMLNITQGGLSKKFYPYALPESSSEFYCYAGTCTLPVTSCAASSNVVEYNMVQDRFSNIFGYINSTNNMLGLGFIHDTPTFNAATCPNAPVDTTGGDMVYNFSGANWNTYANVTVSDDAGQFVKGVNPEGNWAWGACCTDGGMVDMVNLNVPWTITINPGASSGIDYIDAKNPGRLLNRAILPDIANNIIISYTPNPAVNSCGNGVCDKAGGECLNCISDCDRADCCGNNIAEIIPGEICDGTDLNGYDCISLNPGIYTGGTLSCRADCVNFDATGCAGAPATCNNGICDTSSGENATNCPSECQ